MFLLEHYTPLLTSDDEDPTLSRADFGLEKVLPGEPIQSNLTRSYRAINARSTEFTSFNDGVAGNPVVRTVSPDGRSYTQTARGTNVQGVAFNNVLVFDRVR